MKSFSQYRTEKVQLVQPSIWKRIYQLRTAETVLLTMTYPKVFSSLAIVEGFGEIWEFQKPKWWRSNLDIKKQHNQLPFAKFIVGKWGSGGMFELPNGERIEYVYELWKNKNELFSQQKIKIISLKRESLFKTALNVTIEHESELIDKNPWIIMIVYDQILSRRQAANGAA
ncbi:MAG: hypothetical protein Q8L88_10370 [Bacteroidota bacterium]|nr:hypothetical protein [Bacteroidota bacterium]